jgi:putative hemolysin
MQTCWGFLSFACRRHYLLVSNHTSSAHFPAQRRGRHEIDEIAAWASSASKHCIKQGTSIIPHVNDKPQSQSVCLGPLWTLGVVGERATWDAIRFNSLTVRDLGRDFRTANSP